MSVLPQLQPQHTPGLECCMPELCQHDRYPDLWEALWRPAIPWSNSTRSSLPSSQAFRQAWQPGSLALLGRHQQRALGIVIRLNGTLQTHCDSCSCEVRSEADLRLHRRRDLQYPAQLKPSEGFIGLSKVVIWTTAHLSSIHAAQPKVEQVKSLPYMPARPRTISCEERKRRRDVETVGSFGLCRCRRGPWSETR